LKWTILSSNQRRQNDLGADCPLKISTGFVDFVRPQYLEAFTAEIKVLNHPNISLLKQGDEFTF
jgi:hypothetical protein